MPNAIGNLSRVRLKSSIARFVRAVLLLITIVLQLSIIALLDGFCLAPDWDAGCGENYVLFPESGLVLEDIQMSPVVAICPDDYTAPDAPPWSNSASSRWAELLRDAGYEVRFVDVYRADILEQLCGCIGFMWRWGHVADMQRVAKRLLPVLEGQLGLAVYPNQDTCWHYDDKIAQSYLLKAAGIPIPETWVWYTAQGAKEWLASAKFPLVLKLYTGAGSENVRLIHTREEAEEWVACLFGPGILGVAGSKSLTVDSTAKPGWWEHFQRVKYVARHGGLPVHTVHGETLHRDYVLFQEFLDGNEFDTRITVIGKRAFGFRRFNRAGDFRASGSGKIDWDPHAVDLDFVRLGFRTALATRSQSCAIDGLYSPRGPVTAEISYTYVSTAVYDCPGHWELRGDTDKGELVWCEGRMWPEEAQITDFLGRLKAAEERVTQRA